MMCVSFLRHVARVREEEHVHFAEVRRAVHVDEPGDVLVRKVAEESDLAQDAFRERDLFQRAGHHLDRHGLP